MNYDELLEQLKNARMAAAISKAAMDDAMDEFTSSDDRYTFNKNLREQSTANIVKLEEEIKAQALNDYRIDSNKHPHGAIEIKIFKTFRIVNPSIVLDWVKKNLADALIYDEKKVKNYATKIGAIEGTELVEEPRVQIASEL